MSKITARDFKQLVSSSTEIKEIEVTEKIDIGRTDNIYKSLTFFAFEIQDLIIKDQTLDNLQFIRAGSFKSLSIVNCRIGSLFLLNGIQFQSFSTDEKTSIEHLIISVGGKSGNVNIKKSQIKEAYFEESSLDNVVIENTVERCNFGGRDLSFKTLTFSGVFESIQISSYHGQVINLTNLTVTSFRSAISSVSNQLQLKNVIGKVLELSFPDSETNLVHIKDVDIDAINIFSSSIKDLRLEGRVKTNLKNSINYTGGKILSLSLKNLITESLSTISFEKIQGVINLDGVNNQGLITISNSELSSFNIVNSDCGDLILRTIKGENYLNPLRSDLRGIKLYDADWSQVINENFDAERYNSKWEFYENLRSTYCQLKDGAIQLNDRMGSLEFKTNELRIHFEMLKLIKWKHGPTQILSAGSKWSFGSRMANFANYLIQWTHKNASGFGQNVLRPFLLLFFAHLVFYNILLFVKFNVHIGLPIDCKITCEAAEGYFMTLLPTHDSELKIFENVGTKNIGGAVDFIIRLCSGYFIYYFVVATRKYHQ